MLKWLHISDFHFGKNEYEQKFSSDKLIGFLEAIMAKGERLDFVFVTGDIAQSGSEEQYNLYRECILEPLLALYGDDFSHNVFTVPGNHDLDRDTNSGFSKPKFLQPDGGYFLPTDRSKKMRKMLSERFEGYVNHSGDVNAASLFSELGAFSVERRIKNINVGIVGVNTAWLCDGENDKYYLAPGYRLVRDALKKQVNADVRIVLGHHPLSWLAEDERIAFCSVLGEYNAIYLHGHMHHAWAEPYSPGSGDFLTIQTGAGWQAPEGSKWKNGFLIADYDDTENAIYLRPHTWNFRTQSWFKNLEPFHSSIVDDVRGARYNAPAPKEINYAARPKLARLGGWDVMSLADLQARPVLEIEDAIRYFDGAEPSWDIVLSGSIPRREIVSTVREHFLRVVKTADLSVTVLLGAGCEGKTTAMLQAVSEIVVRFPRKRVLYRKHASRKFIPSQIIATLQSHDDWLVVVDQAEEACHDILKFINDDCPGYSGRIDFVLVSRDSDWRASGAEYLIWDYKSKYKAIPLKNLTARDAEDIVGAWSNYGQRGLGEELYSLPEAERAKRLRYYAKKEAKGRNDAFFGALLTSRHSSDLVDHAQAMLANLERKKVNEECTLKDALAYIAVMHSQGFDELNGAALAAVLGVDSAKLNSEVLQKLGEEAPVSFTAKAVYTRHRYIANAVVEVLETRLDEDVSKYFISLAISETRRAKSETVLGANFWRYELAERLFVSSELLGVVVAQALYDDNPHDYHLLTKLAYLYRKAHSVDKCLPFFRGFTEAPQHRGFYFEWGVCEGTERNFLEQALLAAYAMSDDCEPSSVKLDQAIMFLSNLSQAFKRLFSEYVSLKFQAANDAALSLLWILTKSKKSDDLPSLVTEFTKLVDRKRAVLFERSAAITTILEAINELPNYGVRDDVSCKICVDQISFHSLGVIVANVERQMAIT